MKTIHDFKIRNDIAFLDGVAYLEEAKVVDEFARKNREIEQISVCTKDKRFFKLLDGRLVSSTDECFINPYYEAKSLQVEESSNTLLERLSILEGKVEKIERFKEELIAFLNK